MKRCAIALILILMLTSYATVWQAGRSLSRHRLPGPPRAAGNLPSEIDQPGWAVADQAGALDVAPHGAQVAMAGVAHDVLVAHPAVIGCTRLMKPTRSAWALNRSNPSTVSPAMATPRARIWRTASRCSAASGDRLPSVERAHRAGVRVGATRQADLGPLPGLVGLSPGDAQPEVAGNRRTVLDLQGHQFGAAQCAG